MRVLPGADAPASGTERVEPDFDERQAEVESEYPE